MGRSNEYRRRSDRQESSEDAAAKARPARTGLAAVVARRRGPEPGDATRPAPIANPPAMEPRRRFPPAPRIPRSFREQALANDHQISADAYAATQQSDATGRQRGRECNGIR